MTLRKALLAATVLALPVAAQAQPVSGLYVGAGAGLNFHQETRAEGQRWLYRQPGAAAVLSVGWGFGNGLRAEIEGNYRYNELDKVRINGVTVPSAGNVQQYGAMVNVLYDIQTGTPLTPYLGVGAGYGWFETNKFRAGPTRNILPPNALVATSNDVGGAFAYQAIAGLGYSLSEFVPGLALTAEYRFYGTLDPEVDGNLRLNAVNGPRVGTFRAEPDNYNHSVLVGVRYAFNAPRPVPPVATPAPVVQPPATARTYLVFFDWDRADLTARAREIIGEAAQNARRVGSTRLEVAGHADRSGTPQYNQRLSQRRAEAVAAELVSRGVSRNEITVTAFGESRPLVPTADGVREPQNRRVEIVLR